MADLETLHHVTVLETLLVFVNGVNSFIFVLAQRPVAFPLVLRGILLSLLVNWQQIGFRSISRSARACSNLRLHVIFECFNL